MRTLLLTAIALVGCSHTPYIPGNPDQTSIALFMSPYLNLGGSKVKKGGLDRVYNLLENWRPAHDRLLLIAGTTFVPHPRDFNKKEQVHYQKKARFMLEGLNRLKPAALSPSQADLFLGKDYLMALRKMSRFPWISANLIDRRRKQLLFPSHLTLDHEGHRIYVIGLTHETADYPVPDHFTILPPALALKRALSKLPKKPGFVVLLSTLDQPERFEIESLYPHLHLVLGSRYTISEPLHQIDSNTLYMNPLDKGREIGLLDFALSLPFLNFYNKKIAENATDNRKHYLSLISTLNQVIRSKRGPVKRYLAERKEYRDTLSYYETIPRTQDPKSTIYDSSIVSIDRALNQENPLTIHIERWEAKAKRLGYLPEEKPIEGAY